MAGAVFKVLVAVAFVVSASLAGAGVSAQTRHVVGGGPDFNVTAWLLGRSFTVGDKIRFEGDESMAEVRGAEELVSCNVTLTNPIKMYTEVALEEEGVRYFTSTNPDTCRKGLKLPVTVNRRDPYDPSEHDPEPPFEPEHDPEPPFKPEPEPYKPDVPYPPTPSAATARLNAFFSAATLLSIYCMIRI